MDRARGHASPLHWPKQIARPAGPMGWRNRGCLLKGEAAKALCQWRDYRDKGRDGSIFAVDQLHTPCVCFPLSFLHILLFYQSHRKSELGRGRLKSAGLRSPIPHMRSLRPREGQERAGGPGLRLFPLARGAAQTGSLPWPLSGRCPHYQPTELVLGNQHPGKPDLISALTPCPYPG